MTASTPSADREREPAAIDDLVEIGVKKREVDRSGKCRRSARRLPHRPVPRAARDEIEARSVVTVIVLVTAMP